jgi:hypothetical protein
MDPARRELEDDRPEVKKLLAELKRQLPRLEQLADLRRRTAPPPP